MRFALPLLLLFALGCGSADTTTITVTGSSTIAPLAAELARAFEADHPDIRVDVQTGGSARGLADVRKGTCDLGMVSRALTGAEVDVTGHLLARDGVALVVHTDNPLTALSSEQVRAIYRGEIDDWDALSGSGPVTVVHKAEGRSTLEVFLEHFGLENRAVKPDVVIGDNEQGIKTLLGNPGAVGYVSVGAAEHDIAEGAALRLVALDGVAPSTASVASGTYPLARELNLVTKDTPAGPVADFLAFATSDAAAPIVRARHFVSPTR